MSWLLAVVGGFASGVFLRSLLFSSRWPMVFAILLTALFGTFAFLKPRHIYTLGAVFCLCAALGAARYAVADTPLPSVFMKDFRQQVRYEGIVVADPDVRDSTQRVQVRVTRGGETTVILTVASRYTSVGVGDRVSVSGLLLKPLPFDSEGGRIFRYDKYLQRDGVRFIFNFATIRVIKPAPWYSIPAAFARIKHTFIDGLRRGLPEPYASLAGGITIGGKSGLGKELQDAFIRSGLVQIIVLSGYNVMIVATWVMAALARTPLKKRWAISAGALALVLFVCIAGLSATAIRAASMALIALYARATGRTYAAGRALLFVILLMLIWNPLYLVYDPGFGLSVVATAGLIWLAPIIEAWFEKRFKWKEGFWRNAFATTLSAQIAVLPLLLYDTGNLSLVALPANLLAMPAVPLAMGMSWIASFAGMLFGSWVPILAFIFSFPAYVLNAYLVWLAEASANVPFAAFTLPLFPFWLVLVSYAALTYAAITYRFSTTPQLRLAKKASI